MNEFAKRQSFSKIARRHSELLRGPALLSAMLREERKLAQKIQVLDSDKRHSISHMESEIDFFRKKTAQQADTSSDDCNMSVISEAGSEVSDLEEEEIVEEPGKQFRNLCEDGKSISAGKQVLRGTPLLRNPKRAFLKTQENVEYVQNRLATRPHNGLNYHHYHPFRSYKEHQNEQPPTAKHGLMSQQRRFHGNAFRITKEQGNELQNTDIIVHPEERHHYVSKTTLKTHREQLNGIQKTHSTNTHSTRLHKEHQNELQNAGHISHRQENPHSHQPHIPKYTAINQSIEKGHGHSPRRLHNDVHKCHNNQTSAHEVNMIHVRKDHSSAINIGIDANELAKMNCDSPILFRTSFARVSTPTAHGTYADSKISPRVQHKSLGKMGFCSDRNRFENPRVNLYLNPMLFHPRFNNFEDVSEDDHDSFQALKKCRYLRIPKRNLVPEMENAVD